MSLLFTKHYTRAEARSLIPTLTAWLERLEQLREETDKRETHIQTRHAGGEDLGGTLVNELLRRLVETQDILKEFETREIQIKDLERGLVDFPCLQGGREIFLCWEKGEDDIEFWHELDTGYAGREPL